MSVPFLMIPRLYFKLNNRKNPFYKKLKYLGPFLALANEATWDPTDKVVRQIGRPLVMGEVCMTERAMLEELGFKSTKGVRCFLAWCHAKQLIDFVPEVVKNKEARKEARKEAEKEARSSVICIRNYESIYAGRPAKEARKEAEKEPEREPVKRQREEENLETAAKAAFAGASDIAAAAQDLNSPAPKPSQEEAAIAQKMAERYSAYLPKCGPISAEVVHLCNARYREALVYTAEKFQLPPDEIWRFFDDVWSAVRDQCPFLMGHGPRGFKISFKWAMGAETFWKIAWLEYADGVVQG